MLEVNTLSKATVEDLASDPKKYGLPTLQEFASDPEKYKMSVSSSELMAQIDRGSDKLNRHVVGHDYYVGKYKCDSLEQAERMILDMGVKIHAKSFTPEVIDIGAGKCRIKVTFKTLETLIE